MLQRTVLVLSVLVLVAFLVVGCGDDSSRQASQDPAKIVSPLDEYSEQAEQDINEENAEEELEELEQDIDADWDAEE